jgi:hypothetical protein
LSETAVFVQTARADRRGNVRRASSGQGDFSTPTDRPPAAIASGPDAA